MKRNVSRSWRFRDLPGLQGGLLLVLTAGAVQAATVYSSTVAFSYSISDSIGVTVTGEVDQPTLPSYLTDRSEDDGESKVTINAGVNDFSGSSSLQMVHQHDVVVPSFPEQVNSINTILQQTVRFVAGSGDGNFTIAGSATGVPTPGSNGSTIITLILRDLTLSSDIINTSVTSGTLVGSAAPPVALVDGHHYELILHTENHMQSSSISPGGTVSTGGVLNLTIGSTWGYDEAIPEPASALLAGFGMCFGVMRRRRG